MIENLLVGLPGDRPGGLVLTIIFALGASIGALVTGFAYAAVCVRFPRSTIALQAASAFLRGVPLLLLIFFLAQLTTLPAAFAGLVALILYSFSHIGEILRSYLAAYPAELAAQARVVGVGPVHEWLTLRLPWAFARSFDALGTHWVSLLKDTGALVVLGIGELTTVGKVLGEGPGGQGRWLEVMLWGSAFYLLATLFLLAGLHAGRRLAFVHAVARS